MHNPLVSVVVTSYNQKRLLSRAIDSVLNQTYRPIQIVVVDDHSSDSSPKLIKSYKKQHPDIFKTVFQKKNVGIPKNKNTGFKKCDGGLITYLDGDDFYYPKKIEKEVKSLLNNEQASIAISNFHYIDSQGRVLQKWADNPNELPAGDIFKNIFALDLPHHDPYRCELVYKEVLEKINYYDENIPGWHDWEARIRMTKRFSVTAVDYIGSAYNRGRQGVSFYRDSFQQIKEMRGIIKKNKHLLDDLPGEEANQVLKRINYLIDKRYLDSRKQYFTFSPLVKFLFRYPAALKRPYMIINILLPHKMMLGLSKVKRAVLKKKGTESE